MATYEVPDNDPADDLQVDLNKPEPQKVVPADPDIEIVDDTPEADRNRPPRRPGTPSAVPNEDEIGTYTKGVQDRLRKMSWEYHEERRAKEALARENDRAINFAKNLLEQNKKLQEMISSGHKTMKESSKNSAENEITVIKSALTQAITAGDGEKIAELQEKLGRATARAEAVTHIPDINFPEPELPPQAPQQQQQAQPRVSLTETNQAWLDKNPWFGTDPRMTAIAMAAHEELIKSGVQVESKAYYDGIDREVREVFPDQFDSRQRGGNGRQAPLRSNVAPTVRAGARSTGKVTLTLSEQRVAEKLGVPLKDYAAQKLLRMEQENG